MPQTAVNRPRTPCTSALTSPKRSTTAAKRAPMAYSAGIPTRITPRARAASSGPIDTPKPSHSATPTTAKIQMAHTSWLIAGPKSTTRRDAGVRKMASSEPRTCSVRRLVPGPHRMMLSHMYVAQPTKRKPATSFVPVRAANAAVVSARPPEKACAWKT